MPGYLKSEVAIPTLEWHLASWKPTNWQSAQNKPPGRKSRRLALCLPLLSNKTDDFSLL